MPQSGYNGIYTDWICDGSNSNYPSVCPSSAIAGYVMAECSASCGFTTLINPGWGSTSCVPIGSVPTSPPINYTCESSGGQCIPMAPCNPGYDYYGTGGTLCPSNASVCCMPMTITLTPTPTIYVPPIGPSATPTPTQHGKFSNQRPRDDA